jgi:hypothetical protein
MTTYSHTITLNDSERGTLGEALRILSELCDKNLTEGPKAPYYAHRVNIDNIFQKLNEGIGMTSTSSHLWPEGKIPPDAWSV